MTRADRDSIVEDVSKLGGFEAQRLAKDIVCSAINCMSPYSIRCGPS